MKHNDSDGKIKRKNENWNFKKFKISIFENFFFQFYLHLIRTYFYEILRYDDNFWCKLKLRSCSKTCESFLPPPTSFLPPFSLWNYGTTLISYKFQPNSFSYSSHRLNPDLAWKVLKRQEVEKIFFELWALLNCRRALGLKNSFWVVAANGGVCVDDTDFVHACIDDKTTCATLMEIELPCDYTLIGRT